MRYTIVALVLLTLACSKKESSSEAPAETEAPGQVEVLAAQTPQADPDKAQLPAPGPPTVKLITAGKPPLRKVRWQFREGAKEGMEMTIATVTEMKGGGWDDRFVPIAIARTIEFATQAVSADGTAEVAVHIREVAELETKDANTKPTEGLKGATGTYRVDSTGVVQDLVLVPPPDSKYKASNLVVLNGLIRSSVFPVPTEAIGVGAKWSVTQVVHEYQMQMKYQTAIELVERTGSELVLRVEIEGRGSKEAKVGEQQQAIRLDIDTNVLAKLNSTKLVPRSSKFESQAVQTVQPAGVDEPTEQLKVTIDRTVEMRRK